MEIINNFNDLYFFLNLNLLTNIFNIIIKNLSKNVMEFSTILGALLFIFEVLLGFLYPFMRSLESV